MIRPLHAVPRIRLEAGIIDHAAALVSGAGALERLREKLRSLTGCERVMLAPSGRYALAALLRGMPQAEVIVPAYTCPAVIESVLLAGKRPVFVDSAPGGLNPTSREFAPLARADRVMIATHQFGVPTDIEAIMELSRLTGCPVIEDAAACFGGAVNGRWLGTFGDGGLLSFEKSKRLSAIRGGAVLFNCPEAQGWYRDLPDPPQEFYPWREMLYGIAYNVATRPVVYNSITLPWLLKKFGTGKEARVETEIGEIANSAPYTQAFHAAQATLILRQLARFDQIARRITLLTRKYTEVLKDSGVRVFVGEDAATVSLVRYPVVFPGRVRAEVFRKALQAGLDLGIGFTKPCCPEADRNLYPNASWLADNIMFLPLYSKMSTRQAEETAQKVTRL